MVRIDDALKSGSTAIRLWRYLHTVGPKWAESSYSLRIARQLSDTESTLDGEKTTKNAEPTADAELLHDDTQSTAPSDEPTKTTSPVSSTPSEHSVTDTGAGTIETQETSESGVYTTALSYRLVAGIRQFVESSWLYRWLTAEPDTEVVVIDLRETLSAGPLLAQIDQRIRDFIAVMPTSGGLRRGYRLRRGIRDHPIRILSFGALCMIIIGFVGIVATGGPLGITTFVLIAGLLVAARGTQNRTPLSEIIDSSWYQILAKNFEPPAPPEGQLSDQQPDSTTSTISVEESNSELQPESK